MWRGMSDNTGQEEQFRVLYQQTYSRIAGFVTRRSRSPEDAADAIAETYLTAWRRWDQVTEGEAALYWLYKTARFVIANDQRATRARSARVQRLAIELARIAPAANSLSEDERLDALAALGQLPPKWREVVLLNAWEGLNVTAIAEVLGCTPNAVRVRLHRARRLLNQLLTADPVRPQISGTQPANPSPAGNWSCNVEL